MTNIREAEDLASNLLAIAYRTRWAHVAAVAERAGKTAATLDVSAELLVASAWLHDIGYAGPALVTEFHPLDGARFLRSQGIPDAICCLVAHHSYAEVEGDLRGLGRELREEFPRPDRSLMDVLCYCDMVTGPTGESVSVEQRLIEIRARYGPGDVVTQFIDLAEDELVRTVRRVEGELTSTNAI